ncbi:MAG: thymidine phosphorylase [Polyangia bacterium]|mgnify:FL=1|jgi:pyrimidine-nucleoside phosphorylase/thymidine phosphorylase
MTQAATYNPVEIIRKKRDGNVLSDDEIRFFISAYASGKLPDYQASALLMAIYFSGMSEGELLALTDAMLRSGEVISLSDVPGLKIDKHSTGGIGDKISLHLAPAVAACGVRVPMISGRGLGHTGGTLDKLESIPGFSTRLSIADFRTVLRRTGLSLIGQTDTLVPADKALYALRDVTATVESIPLIAASIMSKKLAEGIDGLVLDVKVGSGAFMKTRDEAYQLASTLVAIGRRAGKQVTAFLTNMDQPLGRYVGNAAEVLETLQVLSGQGPDDLVELTRVLGGEMLRLGGVVATEEDGHTRIMESLRNGEALQRLQRCAAMQGAMIDLRDPNEPWLTSCLHPYPVFITAQEAGYVSAIDAEAIGWAGVALGAGRERKEDTIDPAAYIYLDRKVGELVEAGEPLCHFACAPDWPEGRRERARLMLQNAYKVSMTPPTEKPLILDVLR